MGLDGNVAKAATGGNAKEKAAKAAAAEAAKLHERRANPRRGDDERKAALDYPESYNPPEPMNWEGRRDNR